MLQPDTADSEKQPSSFSHVLLSFSSVFLQLPHLNGQMIAARQVPCLKLFMLLGFFCPGLKEGRFACEVRERSCCSIEVSGWLAEISQGCFALLLLGKMYFSPLASIVEPWINKQEISLYELCLKRFLLLFGSETFLIKIEHSTVYSQIQTCLY